MPLDLEISLDHDIKQINGFFSDLKFRALTTAARQALNKTVTATRSNALKELRKRRKAKLKDLKSFVRIKRASGGNIAELEARVDFAGVPLPMILFLVGQKSPKRQTLPNRRRKPRKFEIVTGQRKEKAGLFVEKAKRGGRKFRVFRRADPNDRSKGFKAQSTPSIAATLRKKKNMLRRIENHAIARLQKEFDSALRNQLSKLKL
jgi:hypothetical protein